MEFSQENKIMDKCSRENFLVPEIRDGTSVSEELKEVWKVLLDILEEIMRICDKYNLRWTLEGGSLLGAVRHHGIIPWDDDIDVVMPRKDYDKLARVLPKELPPYYEMQATGVTKDFYIPHIMVRDSRTTGIDPLHAKNKWGFNMGIRIDIMALDGMPKSALVRKLVKYYILFISAATPRTPWTPGMPFAKKLKHIFGRIFLAACGGRKGIYWLRELPLRMLPMEKYEWCGSLVARNFWHPHSIRKTAWFDEFINVPFEYLKVPVPKEYDKILTQQFKEWRTPVKGGSYHGELYFDVHTDYKTTLMNKFGYKPSDFS